MNRNDLPKGDLVLLGCGKMGSAILQGWLSQGIAAKHVYVIDPFPSAWVQSLTADGLHLNTVLPDAPVACLLAVKPQMMGEALPQIQGMDPQTLYISIAAGTTLTTLETILGEKAQIIRAMPNTPAAIQKGITAFIGNKNVSEHGQKSAFILLSAIGEVVALENEEQMNAVTGLSGSGPAYVFHMIEAMAAAGVAQGLSEDISMQLAIATVSGAGQLAQSSPESPAELRVNVTSPNGTTQAGLEILMGEGRGLRALMSEVVGAATKRAEELGKT